MIQPTSMILFGMLYFIRLKIVWRQTTWGHSGYAEAGTGITERIKNKPGVSKVVRQ